MITEKDLQRIERVLDKSINRLMKKLDTLEAKQLTTIEEKLDFFVYLIKRLEVKQEILEEEILTIKKHLDFHSHN